MAPRAEYKEVQPRSRKQLERAFSSGQVELICDAMFSAAQHEPDWRWTQERCLEFLKHSSLLVRSVALVALGEIATFRGHLDLDVVLPAINGLASDAALEPFVTEVLEIIREKVQAH